MLTSLPTNQTLLEHFEAFKDVHMRDLFNEDSHRFTNFSLQAPHIFIDYSKNRISKTTLELLFKLAEEAQLTEQKQSLFTGTNFNNENLLRPKPCNKITHSSFFFAPLINSIIDCSRIGIRHAVLTLR